METSKLRIEIDLKNVDFEVIGEHYNLGRPATRAEVRQFIASEVEVLLDDLVLDYHGREEEE